MSAVSVSLETDTFRPLRAAGRPIFRWDRAGYAIFYAPGCLCVVDLSVAGWFESLLIWPKAFVGAKHDTTLRGRGITWETELRRRAAIAAAQAECRQEMPFSPECLTLYMSNKCNLNCRYCYAAASPSVTTSLELDVILAAAELVADNCRQKNRPFFTVFHGGGEPTLHREQAERTLSALDKVAAACGVQRFGYVATNGVMSEKKAVWLARRFDLVGLSCDGPPEIQNAQRPLCDGRETARQVERTAHILRAEGQRIHLRATITRVNVRRQAEIVDYFCDRFLPQEIHFEPMYAGGRADSTNGLGPLETVEFVEHFLRARQKAQDHGIQLLYAGCRLYEIHGPYCNVFRDVLNLVPGGVATACFKTTTRPQARTQGLAIGALDEQNGRFVIDQAHVRALRSRLDTSPARCRDCFNQFHCARECPEFCPGERSPANANFRCQVQRAIAAAILQERADALWSLANHQRKKVHGTTIF